MLIKTEEIDGAPPRLKLNVAARRRKNRDVGIRHATAGLWVLPASSQKIPLIVAFNRREEDIADSERVAIIADYKLKHEGREPVQIGATRDPEKVRTLCKVFPDAVWGIAVGACGLVTLDLDRKHGAIEKMVPHLKSVGALKVPVPTTHTGSGGLHFTYSDQRGEFDNTAGELADYGTDVRGGAGGRGGFIVAAGSVMEDSTHYDSIVDLPTMYEAGTIPELPEAIAKMIRNGSARKGEQSATVEAAQRIDMASTEGLLRQAILSGAMPDGKVLLDPAFGFDLETLAAKHPKVGEIVAGKGQTHSDDRFNIVAALKSEGATKLEVAAILMSGEYDDHVGSYVGCEVREGRSGKVLIEGKLGDEGGTFNLRSIAREFERAPTFTDVSKHFGVADDASLTEANNAFIRPTKTTWGFDAHRDYEPMQWAVDGLIPAQGVGVIFGDGNTGKSFMALDVLDHVKRGVPWFGRDVVKGGAMYISGEGQAGLSSRLKALYDARPVSNRFDSIAVRGDLPVFGSKPKLAAKMIEKMIVEASEESGDPIKIVFLDNLSLMEGSLEENATGDMTQIFAALGEISRKLELVFCVLHHSVKSGETYRGSTAIRNSADFVLALTEDKAGVRTVTINKMRDAAKGNAVQFKLKVRKVGVNQFGKDVTSCTVVPAVRDRTALMGAVDVQDEAPELPLADGPNDRVRALVAAIEQIANRNKAEGEKLSDVPVTRGEVLKLLNAERAGRFNAAGEAVAQFVRVHMTRLVGKAVEAGAIRVEGNGDLHVSAKGMPGNLQ
jgi:hypothetical protein